MASAGAAESANRMAVRRPFETTGDPLAGRDGGGVLADHGHDVRDAARLGAQNAKLILCIVVTRSMTPTSTSCLVVASDTCKSDAARCSRVTGDLQFTAEK